MERPTDLIDGAPSRGRVLISTIHYWPEQTGIAPYATGLAEHLVRQGTAVDVLTVMPFYPDWRIQPAYRRRLRQREIVQGVEIRRTRHYVPSRQSALRRSAYEASFLLSGVNLVRVPKPDAVIGIVPALSGGVLAAGVARRFDVPYGLIIQDLSSPAALQSGIRGGGTVAGATRWIESRLARNASAVAIIAEGFRPYLEEVGVDGRRIHRVRNWTHIGAPTRPRTETRAALGFPDNAFVCLHAGNMGLKQGLENVIDAARSAAVGHPNLLFVLMGNGNQREHLQHLATDLANVRFLPAEPEETFPDVLAAADVLLVNQLPSVTDMALPGKLTSYFASGRPVIAAVNSASETARELALANSGIVVPAGRPHTLVEAIMQLNAGPEEAEMIGLRGRAFAAGHLTEQQALAGLDDFVSRVVNDPL